jgi:hypothetical protein
VIESAAREAKACSDVFRLEIGKLLEDLLLSQPRCQEVQDVHDANAHPPNTWTPAALGGVYCNSVGDVCHDLILLG